MHNERSSVAVVILIWCVCVCVLVCLSVCSADTDQLDDKVQGGAPDLDESGKKIRWNEEPYIQLIRDAVAVVLRGNSASKVAKARNIPGRTLRRYVMHERKRLNKPRVLKKPLKKQAEARAAAAAAAAEADGSITVKAVAKKKRADKGSKAKGTKTATVVAVRTDDAKSATGASVEEEDEDLDTKVRWNVEPHLSRIRKAVAIALSGQSASKVATEYGIPARTLRRYVMHEREATTPFAIAATAEKRKLNERRKGEGDTDGDGDSSDKTSATGSDKKRMRSSAAAAHEMRALQIHQNSYPGQICLNVTSMRRRPACDRHHHCHHGHHLTVSVFVSLLTTRNQRVRQGVYGRAW